MAAAFPDAISGGRSASARDAVSWLKQHTDGDPASQRAVLSSFRQALDQANKSDLVAALTVEIFDQLGEGYRSEQLQRLAKKGDRDSLIAAALIGIPWGEEATSTAHEAVLVRLFDRYPDDALALYVVALACHVQESVCAHPQYQKALVTRFPGNAVHWVLIPAGAALSEIELSALVIHAAKASEFNDRLPQLSLLLGNALQDQSSPDSAPASIMEPMQAILEQPEVAPSLQRNVLDSVPLPKYSVFLQLCKPDSSAVRDVGGLEVACGTFARLGMQSPGATVLARMVSSVMIRRLFKGLPLAAQAELRRQYVWLSEHAKPQLGADDTFRRELIQFGEWEALSRQAERSGFTRLPSPGWLPADQATLLLPEER